MCCGIIKVHCDKEALKDKALQSKWSLKTE